LSTGIDPRYGPTLFVRTTEDLRHIVDQMRARFQLHFDLELHSPDGPICTVSMEDEDPHDWTLRAVSKIGFVDRQTTVEIAVVYVEVHPVAPGEFIPQNPNPWFSELRFDPHEEPYPAVVDTVAGLQSQPHWSSVNFPIDVVYTWVDGSDPVLARDRNEALGQDALTDRALDATSAARFTSRDELKYSLRSFEKFAPWVRKFYVVTDRQVPVWLRENDRIEIVDHRDLFPDVNVLPVFNSHSIETVLHRIEGLSEHFIYANDDVMLVSDVFPSDFFDQCGSVAVHFSNVKVNVGLTDQPHLVAAENNRSFLNSSGFGTLTNSLVHVPHSHRVSILQEIEQRYPDAIARTRSSKFRGPEDISLLSSFAQYYALSTGRGFEGKLKYTYLSLANSRLEKLLDKIESQRNAFNVFAIGDVAEPTAISQRNEAILFEYLENRFDQLSFAEK